MELPDDFPQPPSSLPEKMEEWGKEDKKLFADYLYVLSEEQRKLLATAMAKEYAKEAKKQLPYMSLERLVKGEKHSLETTFERFLKNREIGKYVERDNGSGKGR